MKLVKYLIFTFFCFLAIFIFIFLNLGKYLDITSEAKKSDIIITLGGGSLERLKESILLQNKSFITKNILILTGDDRSKKEKAQNKEDKRIKYIKDNKIQSINIIHNPNLKSTIEEIVYIKNFMKRNNYKKAIIVSDPPHSRRISIILKHLVKKDSLEFTFAKINSEWWNKNTYYKNKRALKFAINELFKISYTHMKFIILDKFGLEKHEDKLKNYIYPIQKEIEKKLVLYII